MLMRSRASRIGSRMWARRREMNSVNPRLSEPPLRCVDVHAALVLTLWWAINWRRLVRAPRMAAHRPG